MTPDLFAINHHNNQNIPCKTEDFDLVVNQLDSSFCHVPGAIYNPWVLKNTGKGNECEGLPKDLALDSNEKSFIAGFINSLTNSMPSKDNMGIDYTHETIPPVGYKVFFYRNPSKTGINLRYGEFEGYFPDFVIYFMRKDGNGGTALLIDPKGLRTEFITDGLSHYKYMASTHTIAEINRCSDNWRYVAGFVSTSTMENLKFIRSDVFKKLDEENKKKRYARMGIFFNDKMDYKKLIDWTLDENRFITKLVNDIQSGINCVVTNKTKASTFEGGYIGLLARSLTLFKLPEQFVYAYIFDESFKHESLSYFNDKLSVWSEMRLSIGAGLENAEWENNVTKGFFSTEYDKLIELISGGSNISLSKNNSDKILVAKSNRADDSTQ